MRIPGICRFDTTTVILIHRNGYGIAGKTPDFQGAYACAACHDVFDGRNLKHPFTDDEVYRYFADGVWRTREILGRKGLIKITGEI